MVESRRVCFVFFLEPSFSAVFGPYTMRRPRTTGLNQDTSEDSNLAQRDHYEASDDLENTHRSASPNNAPNPAEDSKLVS